MQYRQKQAAMPHCYVAMRRCNDAMFLIRLPESIAAMLRSIAGYFQHVVRNLRVIIT
jgi:hypothetical protein